MDDALCNKCLSIFILKYIAHSIEINIKEPMLNLLSSNEVTGKTELEKFGVMVLKKH
jgi:beta-galactosidase